MATRAVTISIKGDYTDKDVKRAMRDLGSLQKQGPQTQKAVGGITKSFGLLAVGVAAAAVSIGNVTRAIGASIDAASALNESQSKAKVVFGQSSAAISQWAESSASSVLLSKQAALDAAGTYGNLFQAFGIGQQKAAEMSTSLVELAADLSSFNDTSVDDAIQALRSGLSGETEPLKRYGVALNDARLKQEAFNLGIYDGKGILDANQKAQAAYVLIMKDTKLAQGDVKRTADGYANTMRKLDAAVQNASASIGEGFVTGILNATDAMGGSDGAVNMIDRMADGLANITAGLGAVAGAGGSISVDKLTPLTERKKGSFVDWITSLSTFTNPFNAIGNGVAMLGENARISAAQFEDLQNEFDRVAYMESVYAGATRKSNIQVRDRAKYATAAAKANERLADALDRVNGTNRSIIGANIQIRQLRREGPSPSGGKKGKQVTADDRRSYGLEVASAFSDKYDAQIAEGRFKAARSTLATGRALLAEQVSPAFANRVLATPPELQKSIKAQAKARSEAGANQWADSARQAKTDVKMEITVNVKSSAEAEAMARRLARMAALERQMPTGIDWAAVAQRAVGQ